MTMKLLITTCLLLGSLAASAQPASAEHLYDGTFYGFNNEHKFNPSFNDSFNSDHENRWPLLAERGYISKSQAIDIARHRAKGKILSADLVHGNQRAFYKIKVLTDQGRIKTLRINAQAKQK